MAIMWELWHATTGGWGWARLLLLEIAALVGGPDSRTLFQEALGDSDPRVRLLGLELLFSQPDPALWPLLISLCSHPDPDVRARAIAIAGHWRLRSASPVLIRALNDPEPAVREAAAWSLGQVGDREATPALVTVLDDPAPQVRLYAAAALGQIGDSRALPRLRQIALGLEAMAEKGPDANLIAQAKWAAIRISERALPVPEQRLKVCEALVARLAHAPLAAAEADELQRTLAHLANAALLPALEQALRAASTVERQVRLVTVISRVREREQMTATLARLLRHPARPVRHLAMRHLGHYGTPAAVPHLSTIIENARNGDPYFNAEDARLAEEALVALHRRISE